MQKNIGKTDKMVRLVVGAVILLAGVYYGSWWGVVGLVPLLTALVGTCPLYSLFGMNTCSVAENPVAPSQTPPQQQ